MEAPQNLGVPSNVSVIAEACDFKFDIELGFLSPIIKSFQRQKWAWPSSAELPKIWGSPLVCMQWLKLAI